MSEFAAPENLPPGESSSYFSLATLLLTKESMKFPYHSFLSDSTTSLQKNKNIFIIPDVLNPRANFITKKKILGGQNLQFIRNDTDSKNIICIALHEDPKEVLRQFMKPTWEICFINNLSTRLWRDAYC